MATKLRNLAPRIATLPPRIDPGPKTADPHYATPAHRAWREQVIARSGGTCQDPQCRTPNRRPSRLFADHVHELKDDGAALDPANGRALCGACHTRKTLAARTARFAQSA